MLEIISRVFLLVFALTAGAANADNTEKKIELVASFTVLADIAEEIGGEYVEVSSIVGINSDTHVYRARPADARKVVHADILVMNGLGFEGWLERLVQSSGFQGQKIVVTDGLTVIHHDEDESEEGDHFELGGHNHDDDPHAWHSLDNGIAYATAIADGLKKAVPEHQAYFQQRLASFTEQAEQLDVELKQMISSLPENNRRVITSHDAFSYLGEAYGLEFISPQNVSTESEASARDVAMLIRQIREQNIAAVFLENISDDRLMKQIAQETGATIGGTLYSGALSDENGPAPTYLDMMRHNVTTLVQALSQD
ncbi:metal ABC transporter substrate-binding protein [Reinekea marinisedimentorum]|uniref:Zinc/manganese transport system substrate-binding protein n=1 Tax=Reinekea marinisedimentorum TaxID=230495 RepID=A0A4R3I695_9GAMM|nr:metal ABC transporter substrate-binding protein [Reinekea marinisedimentorum]TCS41594.1 zinc/manganese transport system substrate-binding protein [Reinekea marinisedimentorum]